MCVCVCVRARAYVYGVLCMVYCAVCCKHGIHVATLRIVVRVEDILIGSILNNPCLTLPLGIHNPSTWYPCPKVLLDVQQDGDAGFRYTARRAGEAGERRGRKRRWVMYHGMGMNVCL